MLEINLGTKGWHTKVEVQINPPELSKLCKDKLESATFLQELGLQTPATTLFSSENLTEMNARHEDLILKPKNGSQARGVVAYSEGDTIPLEVDENYIIQERVDCLPCDIRILIHKIGNASQPLVRCAYSRVSKNGHIATNLSTGGRSEAVEKILPIYFPERWRSILEQAKAICLQIAKELETRYECPFLQVGIDLLIDRQGNLWVIEMNSGPGIEGIYRLAVAEQSVHEGHEITYTNAEIERYRALVRELAKDRINMRINAIQRSFMRGDLKFKE